MWLFCKTKTLSTLIIQLHANYAVNLLNQTIPYIHLFFSVFSVHLGLGFFSLIRFTRKSILQGNNSMNQSLFLLKWLFPRWLFLQWLNYLAARRITLIHMTIDSIRRDVGCGLKTHGWMLCLHTYLSIKLACFQHFRNIFFRFFFFWFIQQTPFVVLA